MLGCKTQHHNHRNTKIQFQGGSGRSWIRSRIELELESQFRLLILLETLGISSKGTWRTGQKSPAINNLACNWICTDFALTSFAIVAVYREVPNNTRFIFLKSEASVVTYHTVYLSISPWPSLSTRVRGFYITSGFIGVALLRCRPFPSLLILM